VVFPPSLAIIHSSVTAGFPVVLSGEEVMVMATTTWKEEEEEHHAAQTETVEWIEGES